MKDNYRSTNPMICCLMNMILKSEDYPEVYYRWIPMLNKAMDELEDEYEIDISYKKFRDILKV